MKLEQQCCSLQQAKRLKELGVKQESYFHWYHMQSKVAKADIYDVSYANPTDMCREKLIDYYSAFTVAELAEMLPDVLSGSRFGNKWSIMYRGGKKKFGLIKDMGQTKFDTMAECYAAMLIHLIEIGVVKP